MGRLDAAWIGAAANVYDPVVHYKEVRRQVVRTVHHPLRRPPRGVRGHPRRRADAAREIRAVGSAPFENPKPNKTKALAQRGDEACIPCRPIASSRLASTPCSSAGLLLRTDLRPRHSKKCKPDQTADKHVRDNELGIECRQRRIRVRHQGRDRGNQEDGCPRDSSGNWRRCDRQVGAQEESHRQQQPSVIISPRQRRRHQREQQHELILEIGSSSAR